MVDYCTSERRFLKRLRGRFPGRIIRDDRKNREIVSKLSRYLEGRPTRFDLPLDLRGTPFQRRVNLDPTVGVAPILDLQSHLVTTVNFNGGLDREQ